MLLTCFSQLNFVYRKKRRIIKIFSQLFVTYSQKNNHRSLIGGDTREEEGSCHNYSMLKMSRLAIAACIVAHFQVHSSSANLRGNKRYINYYIARSNLLYFKYYEKNGEQYKERALRDTLSSRKNIIRNSN